MQNQIYVLLLSALMAIVLQPAGVVGMSLENPAEHASKEPGESLIHHRDVNTVTDASFEGDDHRKIKSAEIWLLIPGEDEEGFGFYRRQNWRSFDDVSLIRRNEWLAAANGILTLPVESNRIILSPHSDVSLSGAV